MFGKWIYKYCIMFFINTIFNVTLLLSAWVLMSSITQVNQQSKRYQHYLFRTIIIIIYRRRTFHRG